MNQPYTFAPDIHTDGLPRTLPSFQQQIQFKVSLKPQAPIYCNFFAVLPPDVRDKLLEKLLDPEMETQEIYLTGGITRQFLLNTIAPGHLSTAISDVDFVIKTNQPEKIKNYLRTLGFVEGKFPGTWTYHPPIELEITCTDFESCYPIDISIINPNDNQFIPCFRIDTLSAKILNKNQGILSKIELAKLFEPVWYNRFTGEIKEKKASLEKIIAENPLTIFRALRLMHVHRLYNPTMHCDMLNKIYMANINGELLKGLNFEEFLSVLNKVFWRGDVSNFIIGYSTYASITNPAGAFLASLAQNFPCFRSTITQQNYGPKLLKPFVFNQLNDLDYTAGITDYRQRMPKLFALLLFPEYSQNRPQNLQLFVVNNLKFLLAKLKPTDLPVWLQLNEKCSVIQSIGRYLLQYDGLYSNIQQRLQGQPEQSQTQGAMRQQTQPTDDSSQKENFSKKTPYRVKS